MSPIADFELPQGLKEALDIAYAEVYRIATENGLGDEGAYQIALATHEALVNSYDHGSKGDSSKRLRLRVERAGNRLEVYVQDEGQDYFDLSRHEKLNEERLLEPDGRGIFFMYKFTDEPPLMSLVSEDGRIIGRRTRLVKHIPAVSSELSPQ